MHVEVGSGPILSSRSIQWLSCHGESFVTYVNFISNIIELRSWITSNVLSVGKMESWVSGSIRLLVLLKRGRSRYQNYALLDDDCQSL